jgi:hypothetical protein
MRRIGWLGRSSRGGTRTPDPVINSHLLYQLSYSGLSDRIAPMCRRERPSAAEKLAASRPVSNDVPGLPGPRVGSPPSPVARSGPRRSLDPSMHPEPPLLPEASRPPIRCLALARLRVVSNDCERNSPRRLAAGPAESGRAGVASRAPVERCSNLISPLLKVAPQSEPSHSPRGLAFLRCSSTIPIRASQGNDLLSR